MTQNDKLMRGIPSYMDCFVSMALQNIVSKDFSIKEIFLSQYKNHISLL